ncbi:PAS domain-containing protein [Azospirillum griseum]|uniref:histidine kinase n=1 Tax=Azospirillum griseum TaxID=2496639 RepID=A0A431VEU3_9PROT|nr:PAS domain-containing protein [Azospirillum griseum]RTR18096.1 hypothetical protein EJ903_16510 [Azospirillum griseum]
MPVTPPPSNAAVGMSNGKVFVVAPLVAAGVVGMLALWMSPAGGERAALIWLFAASAALAGSGLFALFAARREVRRLERELRREKAAAAWREDAVRAALLDDEADDTTDRPDGEAALTAAALRAAFDAAGEAMVVLDSDHWVIARNPAAATLLGAAAAPETRWDDDTVWPSPVTPLRLPLPDGGVLLLGRDRAQDRVRAVQLDRMDAAADLAGMIVHDVNNTLGAVAGYADFLVADLPAGSVQAGYAARILAATDRSKTGLRHLLSSLREMPVDLQPLSAVAVLGEVDRLLRGAGGAIPSLRNEAGGVEGVGDSALLGQALVGFVLDGGAGGAAPPDEVGSAPVSDRKLVLSARWSGADDALRAPVGWTCHPLLPPCPRAHLLFELHLPPLARSVPPLTVAQIRGLTDPLMLTRNHGRAGGAGDAPPSILAVARAIDGGVVIWTHPGEGTVLRLFVPLAASSLAVAETPARPVTHHVLVVDEVRASGDRVSIGLERLGYEVAVCESAADALEILVDEPGFFDVAVVAGPSAGGMTALSLIGRFKALRPDLPCILCTDSMPGRVGGGAVPQEPDGLDGVDRCLGAPVDLARLADAITRLVGPLPDRSTGDEAL